MAKENIPYVPTFEEAYDRTSEYSIARLASEIIKKYLETGALHHELKDFNFPYGGDEVKKHIVDPTIKLLNEKGWNASMWSQGDTYCISIIQFKCGLIVEDNASQ